MGKKKGKNPNLYLLCTNNLEKILVYNTAGFLYYQIAQFRAANIFTALFQFGRETEVLTL